VGEEETYEKNFLLKFLPICKNHIFVPENLQKEEGYGTVRALIK
jgi:hypothetical protein